MVCHLLPFAKVGQNSFHAYKDISKSNGISEVKIAILMQLLTRMFYCHAKKLIFQHNAIHITQR